MGSLYFHTFWQIELRQQHSRIANVNCHKLLIVEEAVNFLNVRPHLSENWLCSKRDTGLKSIKLKGTRRFREQDLVEFIESRICTTTVDPDSGNQIFFQGEAFMKNNGTAPRRRKK
jgi:hypothetical protein